MTPTPRPGPIPNGPPTLFHPSSQAAQAANPPCQLDRVREPEAMDTPEMASSYDAMNATDVIRRFIVGLHQAHGKCRGGRILDVGVGTARIPIELCRTDPLARIVGIDIAEAMLAVARRNVAEASLCERIELVLNDAKAISIAEGGYEVVMSNGTIHHLADPTPALAEMVRLVAPGGTLFVRDLARPCSLSELNRLVALHAGSDAAEGQALLAASLHAAFTLDEIRECVASLGLPSSGVTLTSDRHWTWVWHCRPTPGTP